MIKTISQIAGARQTENESSHSIKENSTFWFRSKEVKKIKYLDRKEKDRGEWECTSQPTRTAVMCLP